MESDLREDDVIELLWDMEVRTSEGNVYVYPSETRLYYLRPGTTAEFADLHDGGGNIFPNVPIGNFRKV